MLFCDLSPARASYTADSQSSRLGRLKAKAQLPKGPTGQCVKGPCQTGMCYIPAGGFTTGCPEKSTLCDPADGPPKRVVLPAFCIDMEEVTQSAYAVDEGTNPSYFSSCPGCPVETVSWFDAADYCRRESKRLPTSLEWEKAARGFDARLLPWEAEPRHGEDLCLHTVVFGAGGGTDLGCGRNSTWQTGSRPAGASPYGLLDTAGNVSEWVADCSLPDFSSGAEPGCRLMTVRGSNWATPQKDVSLTQTFALDPSATAIWRADLGFRCAYSID